MVGDISWDWVKDKYEGKNAQGRVVRLMPEAALVELEPGVVGAIWARELAWDRKPPKPADVLSHGQRDRGTGSESGRRARKDGAEPQTGAIDGRYLLGTNDDSLSAPEMLVQFKGQEVVERRIKVAKGPIRIHPMFLHKQEGIKGLI